MEKTEAGLKGLYIREITQKYDYVTQVIATSWYYGSRCYGDRLCGIIQD